MIDTLFILKLCKVDKKIKNITRKGRYIYSFRSIVLRLVRIFAKSSITSSRMTNYTRMCNLDYTLGVRVHTYFRPRRSSAVVITPNR